MIRSDLIKQFGFSNDLCEDWELTLDIYFHSNMTSSDGDEANFNCWRNRNSKKVIFDPLLVSYCEASTELEPYFRQRMRVSEGHTRAFRRNLIKILTSKIRLIDKIEFFFIGGQYAKFIPLFALIIMDCTILMSSGIDFIRNNNLLNLTLFIQIANTGEIVEEPCRGPAPPDAAAGHRRSGSRRRRLCSPPGPARRASDCRRLIRPHA